MKLDLAWFELPPDFSHSNYGIVLVAACAADLGNA